MSHETVAEPYPMQVFPCGTEAFVRHDETAIGQTAVCPQHVAVTTGEEKCHRSITIAENQRIVSKSVGMVLDIITTEKKRSVARATNDKIVPQGLIGLIILPERQHPYFMPIVSVNFIGRSTVSLYTLPNESVTRTVTGVSAVVVVTVNMWPVRLVVKLSVMVPVAFHLATS